MCEFLFEPHMVSPCQESNGDKIDPQVSARSHSPLSNITTRPFFRSSGVISLGQVLGDSTHRRCSFRKEATMTTRNEKVHGIIHTAALATGAVGAGMAQVPGSDMPVIMALQTTMIMAIGHEHNVSLTRGAAADLLLTFTSAALGRSLSQVLVGWMPGLGNAINAATAAAMTETVGWAADAYFEDS
jgi:uncharacterized protein (DUF697 family)